MSGQMAQLSDINLSDKRSARHRPVLVLIEHFAQKTTGSDRRKNPQLGKKALKR